MRMYDLIMKKRKGEELTTEEINFFVEGFTDGSIPDYQASAMLMAIFFNKMNKRETADLTNAMVKSGDEIDLSSIKGIKVDKHSTGGVGDKTSICLTPLVASLGIPVANMSGRGLGHTGGTIDKLETFKGFSVELTEEQFIENVNNINIPHLHFGLQLIFNEVQKEGTNQIWIDVYQIIEFLHRTSSSTVYMAYPDSNDLERKFDMMIEE